MKTHTKLKQLQYNQLLRPKKTKKSISISFLHHFYDCLAIIATILGEKKIHIKRHYMSQNFPVVSKISEDVQEKNLTLYSPLQCH